MVEQDTTARGSHKGRVAIVRQTDHYELPVRREAETLHRAGFDVEVICMCPRSGGPGQETVNGVEVTYLASSLKKSSKLLYMVSYAGFFLLAAATLARRHLRRRYAAVQVNTMPDLLVFAAIVPRLMGARVVAYMHEPSPELAETLFGPGLVSRVLAWIEQRVLRFADHAITVTDELKQRYVERGADPSRITVVLNGVDPADRIGSWTPTDPSRDGKFTAICHGAVEERYGQDTIVEAAARLRNVLPDLQVVLLGRGKRVEALVEQIDTLGLRDVVHWEGWVPENKLNDLLHLADVGIVAQKASPYSHLVHTNKMVDYWIFGLPVIASRLRAVSSIYDDSVLEYYEPGDADDLARAIRRLHDDPERREQLSRNGRIAQETHGWAVQQTTYLGVFDRILSSSR
jgi:glycosyltransferase involved in cell wall biosynthesis